MADLNQSLYAKSYEHLSQKEVPEHLADAVSRIVATDDASKPDLGRKEVDIELCLDVCSILCKKAFGEE